MPQSMYMSSILSKALVYIYPSHQWKAMMSVAYWKADTFDYSLGELFPEDECDKCPPPPPCRICWYTCEST